MLTLDRQNVTFNIEKNKQNGNKRNDTLSVMFLLVKLSHHPSDSSPAVIFYYAKQHVTQQSRHDVLQ